MSVPLVAFREGGERWSFGKRMVEVQARDKLPLLRDREVAMTDAFANLRLVGGLGAAALFQRRVCGDRTFLGHGRTTFLLLSTSMPHAQ